MQSCVDQQVGAVLEAITSNSKLNSNTVIVFTSDHGDYAGSHNLRAKAGGLYDEIMNVPLYISFPEQRINLQTQPVYLPYVCSTVDMLPFFYTLALGNDSWRANSADLVNYLSGREAIFDAIFSATQPTQQRRVSSIPMANPFGTADWQSYQPFILHTTDEYSTASIPYQGTPQPSHAIAFRTIDITQNYIPGQTYPNSYPPPYGGGKLGMYSYWDVCALTTAPIVPDTSPGQTPVQQFEFYNYSNNPPGGLPTGWVWVNPAELGNQAFSQGQSGQTWTGEGQLYLDDFNDLTPVNGIVIQNELYAAPPILAAAMQTAFCNYVNYLAAIDNGVPEGCHPGQGVPTNCSGG
jgi:hypothetical protein